MNPATSGRFLSFTTGHPRECSCETCFALKEEIRAFAEPVLIKVVQELYAVSAKAFGIADPEDVMKLSLRELQVLNLISQAFTCTEIGKILHVSGKTASTYQNRCIEKLKLKSPRELLLFAVRHHLRLEAERNRNP